MVTAIGDMLPTMEGDCGERDTAGMKLWKSARAVMLSVSGGTGGQAKVGCGAFGRTRFTQYSYKKSKAIHCLSVECWKYETLATGSKAGEGQPQRRRAESAGVSGGCGRGRRGPSGAMQL